MFSSESEYVVLPGGCRIIIDDASTSSVRGAGLDANGWVTRIEGITGYAEECPRVAVTLQGANADAVEADVDPVTRTWAAPPLFLKEPLDLCGKHPVLQAHCVGNPECKTSKTIFHFPCSQCPTVIGSVDPDGSCGDQGLREVTLRLHFEPPVPAGAAVQILWFLAPGFLSEQLNPADDLVEHEVIRGYPPGTWHPGAVVNLTHGSLDCEIQVELPILLVQSGCSAPQSCPEVNLSIPEVIGCAGAAASATFQAQVIPQPAQVPATHYRWTVTSPGGVSFLRQTLNPSAATTELWQNLLTGSQGPIELGEPGAHVVRVTADVPDTLTGCAPEDVRAFTVVACPECPTVVLDEPQVTGCTPENPAVAFHAQVTPPPSEPASYAWQVGFEGTGNAHLTTPGPVADSGEPWVHEDGSIGPISPRLTVVNAVTVTALIPGLPRECSPPSASKQFVVPQCGLPAPVETNERDWSIPLCVLSLIGVIILLIFATVVIVIAGCFPSPILVITAILLAIAGLAALLVWVWLCGGGLCGLLRWFLYILGTILIIIFWIGVALMIAGVLGVETGFALALIPCGVGTVISSGYLATAYILANILAEMIGCITWRNEPPAGRG